ncbi:hypothetical protein [Streptomyces sp. N35]|uniref:hypothetical protein n=1 Tax=Streptomyces sp. N35 TaxID=2795730 RepID=UPI0018F6CDFB|nr:hypothetical protein [Streptomyces sp. N35]
MLRSVARLVTGGERFLEEWNGTEDQPSVIQRLDNNDARLARIEHELFPNSGSSLRDAVDRLEQHHTARPRRRIPRPRASRARAGAPPPPVPPPAPPQKVTATPPAP